MGHRMEDMMSFPCDKSNCRFYLKWEMTPNGDIEDKTTIDPRVNHFIICVTHPRAFRCLACVHFNGGDGFVGK